MSDIPPIPPPMPMPPLRPPPPRDPHRGARLIVPKLMAGLTIGTIISGILWFTAFGASSSPTLINIVVAVLVMKYVAGLVLLLIRDWRMVGAGIFLSVPIGAVIFFGACAANL